MSGILLLGFSVLFFVFAYQTYGRYLTKRLQINPDMATPAHTMNDGVDYVPAKTPVLLGHHFASIAGAGPIVGPIIAAAFGWAPVYLWILIGAVFIGGVHDYSSIIASIRHKGRSIGQIIENHIGLSGKKLFLIFSWSTLILVVAVFINIVADTFYRTPSSATSSLLFMALALLFGLSIYRLRIPLWIATIFGVILLFVSILIGDSFPLQLSKNVWQWVLIGYIFIASVTPVWILLQPRDYLNSFLLYALIIGGLAGVFFATPKLNLQPVTHFSIENLGTLFPLLFVTVACGAISGFHSLVGSGTTAKQLNKETDAKPVGYGGMLIEGVLAVMALLAVASLSKGEFSQFYSANHFVPAFAAGIGRFIHSIPFLNIPVSGAVTFTALAVSAFALTSLDTATRLGRFAFQEFFEDSEKSPEDQSILVKNRFLATLITVAVGAALTFSGKSGGIWPIFGSANQLLAALALLAVTVWLIQQGRSAIFTLIPMIFMFAVTLSALVVLFYINFFERQNYVLSILASILFILSIVLSFQAYRKLRPVSTTEEVLLKTNK
ncbi:MAG: carbon starvation protein A [Calditrichia bacterium]